jgi:nicotinamidase-related amidase
MSNSSDTLAARSPELLIPDQTLCVLIDVQAKLLPLIPAAPKIAWNLQRLLAGMNLLGVPVLATEQYPAGLGGTVPELRARLGNARVPAKQTFSACGCEEFLSQLTARFSTGVLLCGLETHVCVLQTALDLLALGYRVHLVADAVGARHAIDHEIGLRRMESNGVTLTTTETALFELCSTAALPAFKQLSQLIKEKPPV